MLIIEPPDATSSTVCSLEDQSNHNHNGATNPIAISIGHKRQTFSITIGCNELARWTKIHSFYFTGDLMANKGYMQIIVADLRRWASATPALASAQRRPGAFA